MLNTGKYDAVRGVRNTWAIFSFLLPILPAQAVSFAFLYNFMEMWFFFQTHCKKKPICPCGYSRATSSAYFVFLPFPRWHRLQGFSRSLLDSSCSFFILGWMVLSVPTIKESIPGMHNMKACCKWPKYSVLHSSIRKGDSWIWVT